MGNRAVITTRKDFDNDGIGVYLHWNGGRDSVEAFLKYCALRGFRSPDVDDSYGYAQLARVIGNYFGDGLGVGVGKVSELDCNNFDNGVYIIKDWEIVGREYMPTGHEQMEYDQDEMLAEIDACQPKREQLGPDFLLAKLKKREDIQVGDVVLVRDCLSGHYGKFTVEKMGTLEWVNGMDVRGLPFVRKYPGGWESAEKNPNNYLTDKEYYVIG